MKSIAIFLLVSVLLVVSAENAVKCTAKICKLADSCVCASGISPIETAKTPQFIIITFDEAINNASYHDYYNVIFNGRKNPDGSKLKATFFVPHEYTDYEAVHNLYVSGHEIGTHSITKNSMTDYWAKANVSTLVDEFNGQKTILSKFANIPKKHIVGARTPQFQLNGDNTFSAYKQSEITYDSSWSALSSATQFPYNLKYNSGQQCLVGTCPVESHPTIWVSPVNNIVGEDNKQCNAIHACNYNGTKAEIKTWLLEQFNEHFNDTRTPMNLLLSSAWFGNMEPALDALQEFIDEVLKNKHVFFVTESQLLDWQKKPTEVSKYKTANDTRKKNCKAITCQLKKDDGVRYMRSCVSCPAKYPWLGNPEGKE